MNLQFVADGLAMGAMIGLGAIGLTLTYSILRFANFVHGEFIAWGAYSALVVANSLIALSPKSGTFGPFSFGWPLLIGLCAAMLCGMALALLVDTFAFKRLRVQSNTIVLVIASFGLSLALRSLLEFFVTSQPAYYSRDIQMAVPLGLGVRVTPDQLLVLALAVGLLVVVHVILTRTHAGRAMRAFSENPLLAEVAGIDGAAVVRMTWALGGALAAASGVMLGITVQIRPAMGFDMLLPLFAAAILGGIGSVPGAVVGGLIIGLAEAGGVQLFGGSYRAAVAFLILIAVLLVRPNGLFGRRP